MSKGRFTPEQIIGLLREVDVKVSQGKNVGQICREIGIAEQTYYRWRREYGGMKTFQVKGLRSWKGRTRISRKP
jgi:putative transposase